MPQHYTTPRPWGLRSPMLNGRRCFPTCATGPRDESASQGAPNAREGGRYRPPACPSARRSPRSASRTGPSGRSANVSSSSAKAATGFALGGILTGAAGAALAAAKRSRSTSTLPAYAFSRAINSGAICCNSNAIGPDAAIVSVPEVKRTGLATAAMAGPTMSGQSVIRPAAAGDRLRKAGRVTAGSTAPSPRGPATWRLSCSGAVAMVLSVPQPPAPPQASDLLAWYDRHRRDLPWRARPGETADPYRVWLSEIMLQQTTVAAVGPYYARFLARFPTVAALAAAPQEEVMAAWAGLGYYARARNLHACAKAVAASGAFPDTEDGLRALPGIGPYTAAAIAAIAFGRPTVAVDGNVERVVSRLFAIETPLPAAKPQIAAAARGLRDADADARASDFQQALFDLGATICTPARPACALCVWRPACRGHALGIAASLPAKLPRSERPHRWGVHFWLEDAERHILLRRRPPQGLLGGMTELPGTPWRDAAWTEAEALLHAPMPAPWQEVGEVRHGFTHFTLSIRVFAARVPRIDAEGFLCPAASLAEQALPSVMMKCVRALDRAGGAWKHGRNMLTQGHAA